MTPDELLQLSVGESIDALVTLDMRGNGVPRTLYRAARELVGEPVVMHAAKLMAGHLGSNSPVLIGTGFVFPPWFTGELDGVVGSAVLARAVDLAFGAKPALVLEQELVAAASDIVRTAGLQPTTNPQHWLERPHQALMLSFTKDTALAVVEADRLLEELKPAVLVSVERPGRGKSGVYHMGNGVPVTEFAAKIDTLFERGATQGLPTVAIGDLGNELGMGKLRAAVRDCVPFGAECGCPCGEGIAAEVAADATVFASISDWGAYGLAAALSFLSRKLEVLHSAEMEKRLLRAAVAGGLIDGSGYAIPAVDGMGEEISARLVEMLRAVVEQPLATAGRYRGYFEKALKLRRDSR